MPSWSPDCQRIAFTRGVAGDGGDGDIYTIRADGTDLRQLTNNQVLEEDPAWSPSGKKIAFTNEDYEIYKMKADGTGVKRLTTNPATDFAPDWQPLP